MVEYLKENSRGRPYRIVHNTEECLPTEIVLRTAWHQTVTDNGIHGPI